MKEIALMVSKSEIIWNKLNSTMNNLFNINHLLQLIQNSPLFYHHSFQNVRLLPHQNEVYRSLLSRWPVYGLVADEVGLGKTIEAGATIKYLNKFCNVKRSVLLVPSSLRYQWQREMFNLYGMKYYVYESNSKSLVFSPNNEQVDRINYVSQGNYFNHGVENIIFSWHYLRLRGANGEYRLNEIDQIDLVLVDEAHGARITESINLNQSSTQLHQFLSRLLPVVKHKLLLTATPYQTSLLDYQSILELLMQNDDLDTSSFERISRINSEVNLTTQQKVSAMLEIIDYRTYSPIGEFYDLDEENLPSLVNSYNDDLYILNHPSTIFTIRNTREKLKEIGYHFPNTFISSSPIELDPRQNRLFIKVNEYIENQLFNFETAIKGNAAGLGFVRIIYQQRIVSSFKACSDTLTSRLKKLLLSLENGYVEGELIEIEADEDDSIGSIPVFERIELNDMHINAAQTEINFLKEILASIQTNLYLESKLQDPKIERAIEIVLQHMGKNDTIILFSRFTSTTNFLVERMKHLNQFNFGRYQGDSKEIIIDQEVISYDRQTLSDKFLNGEFPVIICSDAASEGLNLQKANVLINVDVPWNPARLLQRFGRIDRFGQKKNELFFYNLYYPDTVEDRIYTRLIDRNAGFRQILGATPEITSRDHIADLTNREIREAEDETKYLYKNSLLKLTMEDNNRIHDDLLKKIHENENISISTMFRNDSEESKRGVIEINGSRLGFSIDEMDKDYLNLNHPFLKQLPTKQLTKESSLFVLKNGQNQILLYCIVAGEIVYPLYSINELMDYLILGKSIVKNESSYSFSTKNINNGFIDLIKREDNDFIYHNFINFDGSFSEMYKGLYLVEMEVKICVK